MTGVLSIQNRQRSRAVDLRLLRRMTRAVLNDLPVERFELGLHLVAAEEMATVNQTYLQHEGSTDVITFDHREIPAAIPFSTPQPLHGEIFISVPDALRQAREFKTTWQLELIRYVIHGLLHLVGHDDQTTAARRVMKKEENQLTARLAAAFPVAHLAKAPRAPQTQRPPVIRRRPRR